MLQCPKCKYKNPDDAKFCSLCTSKLDPATAHLKPGTARRGPPDEMFVFEPRMLGAGRKTQPLGQAAEAKERHFLVPPTGEPARIEAGPVYLMGREETAQIRITAPRVSRKHAEIRFGANGKPAVHDLGSQNGTLVNGMKLAAHAHRELQDGDAIDVGGIVMTYRLLKPGDPESRLKATGTEATLVGAEPAESGDLTGNVALMPIGDVLDRLRTLKATGLLVIEAGGAKGAIRVEGGEAAAGSYAGLEGQAAIAAVRSLAQGKFRLEMQDPDAAPAVVVVPEAPKSPPPKGPGQRPAGPPPSRR